MTKSSGNPAWDKFIADLKSLQKSFRAWETLNRPMIEAWTREGGEGLKAFALAVVKGEPGRAEAMKLNTEDDTTSRIGFNLGLTVGPMFWVWLDLQLTGKVAPWVAAIARAMIAQLRPTK